jgi:drug/metabolite transporter (DMT)-like permease
MMWATTNMIDKIVLTRYLKDYTLYVSFAAFFGILFAFLVSLKYSIFPIPKEILYLCLLDGFLVILALFFYFKALSLEEVTRIVPLLQMIPLVVLFISKLFLKESLKISQYLGIFFLILGALLVTLKKEEKRISFFRRGVLFIFLACLLFGNTWVLSKYILNKVSSYILFFWSRIGGFIGLILLLLLFPTFRKTALNFKSVSKRTLSLIITSEIISTSAVFISMIALSKGPVSIISTISSTQPFFVLIYTFILTSFFKKFDYLREERNYLGLKLTACFLIIFGFFLLKFP